MTLGHIRDVIAAIASVENTDLELNAPQFDAYLKQADLELFDQGLREFEATKTIPHKLLPFITRTDAFDPVAGTFPGTFAILVSAMYTAGSYTTNIEIFPREEVFKRLGDVFRFPSAEEPICYFGPAKMYVFPTTVTPVAMVFIATPTAPLYFEKQLYGIQMYDSANSVQLGWDDTYHPRIIKLVLSYLGMDIKDALISQAVDKIKSESIKV